MRVLSAPPPLVHARASSAGLELGAAPPAVRLVQRVERAFDLPFGAHANPLRQLGALACLLLAVASVSGVYLYVFFDTGVSVAHASVLGLAHQPLSAGVIARGMHRYAADGCAAVSVLHLAREWLLGHTRGFRWFSWVSGVPLLWLLLAAGIVGFWLAWDELAQFSLTATLEWIDALGVFGEPLARNVLTAGSLDDRFFSLLVFLHIGVPLLLGLAVWLHLQRIARPVVWPARALTLGSIATLALLAVCVPVSSGPAADLSRVPGTLQLDWFYLSVHAGTYRWSAQAMWALSAGITLMLLLLPVLSRTARAPAARVSPAHCNGCARCVADCPYGAVELGPRPGAPTEPRLARVDARLCAGCGICAGACPSSTPLRREANPVSGIDMPQWSLAAVRARLDAALSDRTVAATGERENDRAQDAHAAADRKSRGADGTGASLPCIVVFGCMHAAPLRGLGEGVVTVPLLCAGQLAPAFVQYALRRGAEGVVIVGCRDSGCEYRSGMQWTAQRLHGGREPHLRRSVPASRWQLIAADAGESPRVRQAVDELRRAAAAGQGHV